MSTCVGPLPRVPAVAILRQLVLVICGYTPTQEEQVQSDAGRDQSPSLEQEEVDCFGAVFEVVRRVLVRQKEEGDQVQNNAQRAADFYHCFGGLAPEHVLLGGEEGFLFTSGITLVTGIWTVPHSITHLAVEWV